MKEDCALCCGRECEAQLRNRSEAETAEKRADTGIRRARSLELLMAHTSKSSNLPTLKRRAANPQT